MRKKERETKEITEIEDIIQKGQVCRLGLAVGNTPYIVPLNYGYKDNCLYFHCAKEGRKIDMINQNNHVCFEIAIDCEIDKKGDIACNWTSEFSSVIGYGNAAIVEDFQEKKKALAIIMEHYGGQRQFKYQDQSIEKVGIIKVAVTEITGKSSRT